jgi:hypothetical protein
MKPINLYTETPFHVNATIWMLLMLLFAGGTFAVDLSILVFGAKSSQ